MGRIIVQGDISVRAAIEYNNKEGLSKVYNRALELGGTTDIVVFVHDDILINDCLIYDKLMDAQKRGMDVVGVAGGKGWVPPPDRSAHWGWTTASRSCGMAGIVNHVSPEGKLFASHYGETPARTLTIDGCFMAVMNRGLTMKFNEKYDFDFYDMALSMDAYKLGLKTGVEPVLLTHLSRGEGLKKPEFLVAQNQFLEEYFGV